MKKYNSIILFCLLLATIGCVKDKELYYIKDISSNERSVVAAEVASQVGATVITNSETETSVVVKCLGLESDLKAIPVKLAISYGASISPASGTSVDFTVASDKSVTYTVTSASGKTKTWKVFCTIFNNPYAGSFQIKEFNVTWDDGNGWGNNGTGTMAAKLPDSAPGLDDVITFGPVSAVQGIVSGDYSRAAGADGLFASYVNSAHSKKDWDSEFGQLPAGHGKYYLNADNTVTITTDAGVTYTSMGINASKSTDSSIYYALKPATRNGGLLNWTTYGCYCDFDNIACCSQYIWYILSEK